MPKYYLKMVVIIKKGENVNEYHASFDDANVLPEDGCPIGNRTNNVYMINLDKTQIMLNTT